MFSIEIFLSFLRFDWLLYSHFSRFHGRQEGMQGVYWIQGGSWSKQWIMSFTKTSPAHLADIHQPRVRSQFCRHIRRLNDDCWSGILKLKQYHPWCQIFATHYWTKKKSWERRCGIIYRKWNRARVFEKTQVSQKTSCEIEINSCTSINFRVWK